MSVKKELIVHIETNEEGEYTKVNALDTDPGYFLLTCGQNRIVISGEELTDAINSIQFYGTLFAEERKRREQAKAAPAKAMVVAAEPLKKAKKKTHDEPEGTFVMDPIHRIGPTASELALAAQTKHMQGETVVVTEKK